MCNCVCVKCRIERAIALFVRVYSYAILPAVVARDLCMYFVVVVVVVIVVLFVACSCCILLTERSNISEAEGWNKYVGWGGGNYSLLSLCALPSSRIATLSSGRVGGAVARGAGRRVLIRRLTP